MALLCLETSLHLTTHPLGRNPQDINCAVESIRTYALFGRCIRKAAQLSDITKRPGFQRIFGLARRHPLTGSDTSGVPDDVLVRPNSMIYTRAARDLPSRRAIKVAAGILLPADAASQYILQALLSRYNPSSSLARPLLNALEYYRQRSPFTICLYPVRLGRCSGHMSCERHHPSDRDFSVDGFNQRVELHLLVVAALECLNRNPAEQREFYQQ